MLAGTVNKQGALRMTDRGFGLVLADEGQGGSSAFARYYVWDEENRLTRTVEGALTVGLPLWGGWAAGSEVLKPRGEPVL